ncbi:Uncharacterised protein [Mycobacteroides abscessus subsp. abscessus]|nr:Uncharacterised protein [Mycobacteroides abscessus subsp. abscessus]SKU40339.1 Uncharacterised protein [Mycobacteroides abscessus subsp. abscessus]
MRARNVTAESTMPPVAKGRAPYRSESSPATGPATRNPSVMGSKKIPAHSGVDS